jgi:phosphatidate phosphatase APP1
VGRPVRLRRGGVAAFVACVIACVTAAERAQGRAADAAWLELYTAFATPGGATIVGRAHKGRRPAATAPGTMQGVREVHRDLDVEALRSVRVSIRVADQERIVSTDSHGYFEIAWAPGLPPPVARLHVALVDPRWMAEPVDVEMPVFRDEDGLALLSDVDDTLLYSHARHKVAMVAHILRHPGSELRAFDGAAPTLRALAGTGADARPVVYLSGSPTSFHQRVSDFLERSGFPPGPLILKRFSTEPLMDQLAYKWPHVIALVDALPKRRWILFGDSGERDPETYRRLMTARPGRVQKVYIHLVTKEPADAPRFRGMTAFREWSEVAADLERFGLIAANPRPQ